MGKFKSKLNYKGGNKKKIFIIFMAEDIFVRKLSRKIEQKWELRKPTLFNIMK